MTWAEIDANVSGRKPGDTGPLIFKGRGRAKGGRRWRLTGFSAPTPSAAPGRGPRMISKWLDLTLNGRWPDPAELAVKNLQCHKTKVLAIQNPVLSRPTYGPQP